MVFIFVNENAGKFGPGTGWKGCDPVNWGVEGNGLLPFRMESSIGTIRRWYKLIGNMYRVIVRFQI